MKNLLEIAKSRRSTKNYSDKKIDEKTLHYIYEVAITAPTAFGLDIWRILSIRDKKIKEAITPSLMYGNEKKINDCSDLALIVVKTSDWLRLDNEAFEKTMWKRVKGAEEEFNFKQTPEGIKGIMGIVVNDDYANNDRNYTEWSKRQAYMIAAFLILAAKEQDVWSCPMEGFRAKEMNQILQDLKFIDKDESVALMVSFGYIDGVEHPYIGKIQRRDSFEEKIRII